MATQGLGGGKGGDQAGGGFAGLAEVTAAAEVIVGFVLSGIAPEEPTAPAFRDALIGNLSRRYLGHWWTENPARGEGFRQVSCGQKYVDATVIEALRIAGIPLDNVIATLPCDLSVWCDPGVVTTRIGKGDLRACRIESGQYTPPVSPALSVSAREFKPSPPGSPETPLPLSRSAARKGRSRSNASHTNGGVHSVDVMTPPFTRLSEPNPMGYYGNQYQTAANF